VGLNLPRSGLVQHPDAEDGHRGVFFHAQGDPPASDLERYAKWQREDIPCKLKAIDNCFL
jgi:hypothetical protein